MARKVEVEKARIILESFIRNKGHYRQISEELTAKYGSGYTIGTISNIMNSNCVRALIDETQKKQIENILIVNNNKLSNEEQVNNSYYQLSKEEQEEVIIKLYSSGRTMQQIATAIGISKSKVSRVVKSALENYDNHFQEELENIKTEHKKNNAGSWRK